MSGASISVAAPRQFMRRIQSLFLVLGKQRWAPQGYVLYRNGHVRRKLLVYGAHVRSFHLQQPLTV